MAPSWIDGTARAAAGGIRSVTGGGGGGAGGGGHLTLEPGLDERFQPTVEDAVGVPHLGAGAMVLDHAVGVQHVAADLAAPTDLFLLALALGLLGLAPLHLAVVETRA